MEGYSNYGAERRIAAGYGASSILCWEAQPAPEIAMVMLVVPLGILKHTRNDPPPRLEIVLGTCTLDPKSKRMFTVGSLLSPETVMHATEPARRGEGGVSISTDTPALTFGGGGR